MVKPLKKWLLEGNKVRKDKRSHKEMKKKIHNGYKRLKISNHSIFCKKIIFY